ncbi:MAG: hypothetical protein PVH88_10260 [Ignavibacteria bacterium]|jgi:FtsH-binding integral membrane protein
MITNGTTIEYFVAFIWLLPIARQYRTKLFTFFLLIGIRDVIDYAFFELIYPNNYLINISFFYFAFLTFFDSKILIKRWYYFVIIYLLFAAGWFVTPEWKNHALLLGLILFFLLLAVIHYFIIELVEGKLNLSIFVIITYIFIQISFVAIILLFDFDEISKYYYFTLFCEIFIALFFVLFRVDDDRLAFQL